MRWCILPAHTHSQIRLDLHESNAKSAAPVPRVHVCARALAAAVELVFSPRNKHRCTTATETNANRTSHKKRGALPSPSRRRETRPLKRHTDLKVKLPWFRSVQPRALKHFSIHEHSCSLYSYTLHSYRDTAIYYFIHLKHTSLHLITHATDM